MHLKEYAENYSNRAKSQFEAGQLLLSKLSEYAPITQFSRVADIGCGSGALSNFFFEEIKPEYMIGYDSSQEMIELAKSNKISHKQEFNICSAEKINNENNYDLVITNSAFQWFVQQDVALKNMFKALSPGGFVAIQSSAKTNWCPQFLSAISDVKKHPETAYCYSHYKFPITHYNSALEYKNLVEEGGFNVKFCEIINQKNRTNLEGALAIFKSGAAKAYLLDSYFDVKKSKEYDLYFFEILKNGLKKQCDSNGEIIIEYPRVLIIGDKVDG